jgi:hypothetical protein
MSYSGNDQLILIDSFTITHFPPIYLSSDPLPFLCLSIPYSYADSGLCQHHSFLSQSIISLWSVCTPFPILTLYIDLGSHCTVPNFVILGILCPSCLTDIGQLDLPQVPSAASYSPPLLLSSHRLTYSSDPLIDLPISLGYSMLVVAHPSFMTYMA